MEIAINTRTAMEVDRLAQRIAGTTVPGDVGFDAP
jgi:hypothetical protein